MFWFCLFLSCSQQPHHQSAQSESETLLISPPCCCLAYVKVSPKNLHAAHCDRDSKGKWCFINRIPIYLRSPLSLRESGLMSITCHFTTPTICYVGSALKEHVAVLFIYSSIHTGFYSQQENSDVNLNLGQIFFFFLRRFCSIDSLMSHEW